MQIGAQRLALLAVAAMVPIYAPPAASADGFGSGVPCHYSVPGAIEAPKVYFTTIPGTPYTPPTDEFADSENPSIDSFSASANWGDGTTSPAAVRTSTGCSGYEAYAPAHTYLTPGIYSFSYTIHDSRTSIDHTVGSEKFYVLSALPAPAANVRSIRSNVGVPWSGAVGEFNLNQTNEQSVSIYTASIEWGDGQVSPGVISSVNFGTFAVSGTHTYIQPLSAAVKVSVHGGIETGNWSTANVVVPQPPFELVGTPILAAIHAAKHRTPYEIIFRLNRSLPQTVSGHIEASLSAYGAADSVTSFGPQKANACYAAIVKHAPKAHRRYSFALKIQEPKTTRSSRAVVQSYANVSSLRRRASKQLGC